MGVIAVENATRNLTMGLLGDSEWFRRLADIPGVGYEGGPKAKHARLAGRDEVPRIVEHAYDGQRRQSLMWPSRGGATSASPAQRYAAQLPQKDEPVGAIMRRLDAALDVPGQASDYHFAIQGCIEILWGRRREAPALLDQVEQLCWLDIRLVQARPQIIQFERDGERAFARVLAFLHLVQLYEREGYLREALEVAELARAFGQEGDASERLRARIALVESEG